MPVAETYIVRVYRRDRRGIVGMVEKAGEDEEIPFRGLRDLADILLERSRRRPRPARRHRQRKQSA